MNMMDRFVSRMLNNFMQEPKEREVPSEMLQKFCNQSTGKEHETHSNWERKFSGPFLADVFFFTPQRYFQCFLLQQSCNTIPPYNSLEKGISNLISGVKING